MSRAKAMDEDAEEDDDENLPLSAIVCKGSKGFRSEKEGVDINTDLSNVGNRTRLQLEHLHSQLEPEAVGGKECSVQWKSYSHTHNYGSQKGSWNNWHQKSLLGLRNWQHKDM
jgi:hypothetical protein